MVPSCEAVGSSEWCGSKGHGVSACLQPTSTILLPGPEGIVPDHAERLQHWASIKVYRIIVNKIPHRTVGD